MCLSSAQALRKLSLVEGTRDYSPVWVNANSNVQEGLWEAQGQKGQQGKRRGKGDCTESDIGQRHFFCKPRGFTEGL